VNIPRAASSAICKRQFHVKRGFPCFAPDKYQTFNHKVFKIWSYVDATRFWEYMIYKLLDRIDQWKLKSHLYQRRKNIVGIVLTVEPLVKRPFFHIFINKNLNWSFTKSYQRNQFAMMNPGEKVNLKFPKLHDVRKHLHRINRCLTQIDVWCIYHYISLIWDFFGILRQLQI
jgi:hypothetical protein